jgi:hypothetical protein
VTSLIGWVAVDNRGPSSAYLASDSRFSFNGVKWDCGRKLFACKTSADVFGYCGAVLFPSLVLGQLTELIDAGLLFPPNATPETKFEAIVAKIKSALADFPESQYGFSIAYATRRGEGFTASFAIATLIWQPGKGWQEQWFPSPHHSDLLFAYGSGAQVAQDFHRTWKATEVGRTSRAVFSAFCDAIASGKDPGSGGPPQVVGLYLRRPAQSFVIAHDDVCYLYGLSANGQVGDHIECLNSLFEKCTPSGRPIERRHARPRSLRKW